MAALALALGALIIPACAAATAALHWSEAASLPSGGSLSAVSCVSESVCVAVNHQGDAFSSSDPTAEAPSWSKAAIDPGQSLNAVSCAPGGPCVAVDGRGDAFVSVGADASAWSGPWVANAGKVLTAVSCPTTSLCVAVDEGGEIVSSVSPEFNTWAPGADTGRRLTGVSCSSPSLCVAVDNVGEALTSASPTSTAAWSLHKLDSTELLAVSCSAAGPCVAVDGLGDALSSADPTAATPTWSLTPIDEGERIDAVACAASGLCAAADTHGNTLASDAPASPQPGWSSASPDPGESLAGISCLPGGFCLAVDTAGRSLAGRVPAPAATTLAPTEVTDASATLAGVVDPNDAVLGACSFEYGPAIPYAQVVSCAVLPAPLGGAQDVAAQLAGLAPNTTYHYRILAASPAGTSAGADQAFTTPTSSRVALVHPNPSISGTPAVGQTLTCHPGTPSGSTAQLSYAWLRDLIPIAGATGSSYGVRGQDSGAHLQCEVTATDGGGSASAKSAFVSIPVGGAPASAGETGVGAAVFRNGKLTVPVVCSAQAGGGCEVALRLTAVETLSGHRVVAVAARAKRGAHDSAAALRNLTVTLASARVHLARGAHTTIAVALDTTGRRLLKAIHRYSAYLHVSGTVIGVIEAQLAQQLLTLASPGPSRSAASHAARRR